jgi:hypothetical protein
LLIARRSLLFFSTRCSLLITYRFLLVAHRSLLIAFIHLFIALLREILPVRIYPGNVNGKL